MGPHFGKQNPPMDYRKPCCRTLFLKAFRSDTHRALQQRGFWLLLVVLVATKRVLVATGGSGCYKEGSGCYWWFWLLQRGFWLLEATPQPRNYKRLNNGSILSRRLYPSWLLGHQTWALGLHGQGKPGQITMAPLSRCRSFWASS